MDAPTLSALTSRLRKLDREQLLRLPHDQLAQIDYLLRDAEHDRIDARCADLAAEPIKACTGFRAREDAGCLWWLQNHTRTHDEHWMAKGTPQRAPFPRKSYFPYVVGAFLQPVVQPSPQAHVLFLPKSREMMVSWVSCGFIAWLCQFQPNTFFLIQSAKEDKAGELVRYVHTLWEEQEPWQKERHPLAYSTFLEMGWKNGSRVLGVAQGQDQARTYHPWGVFVDEAAFLPGFQQALESARPVAKFVLAVSTGAPGFFGDQCSE